MTFQDALAPCVTLRLSLRLLCWSMAATSVWRLSNKHATLGVQASEKSWPTLWTLSCPEKWLPCGPPKQKQPAVSHPGGLDFFFLTPLWYTWTFIPLSCCENLQQRGQLVALFFILPVTAGSLLGSHKALGHLMHI